MIVEGAQTRQTSRWTASLPAAATRSGSPSLVSQLLALEANANAQALEKFAAFLLIAYAVFTPIVPGIPLGRLVVSPIDILFPMTAVVLCLTLPRKMPLWAFSLVALVVLSFISLLAIRNPRVQWECALRVVRLMETVAPLLLALNIHRPAGVFRKVFIAFLCSGAVSVLIGLILFWLQIELRSDQQKAVFDTGEYLFRAGGIFGDSSAFGHLVASWFVVLLLAGPLVLSPNAFRIIAPLALMMAAYGMYASSSRSCLMDIGAVLVFCVFSKSSAAWRSRIAAVVPILLLIAVGVIIAFLLGGLGGASKLYEHVSQRFFASLLTVVSDPDAASAGRTELWSQHYQLFLKSPLIGIGYKALYLGMDLPPDNNFVAAAVEVGIFGLAALLTFYGALFVSIRRQRAAGHLPAWALMGLWIGQIVHSITVDIWTFWGSMPVVLLITGLLVWRQSAGRPVSRKLISTGDVPKTTTVAQGEATS